MTSYWKEKWSGGFGPENVIQCNSHHVLATGATWRPLQVERLACFPFIKWNSFERNKLKIQTSRAFNKRHLFGFESAECAPIGGMFVCYCV